MLVIFSCLRQICYLARLSGSALSSNDSWATQGTCGGKQSPWKLSGSRVTDGTACLLYADGENANGVKVVVLPCTSTALNGSWAKTSGGMLSAAQYPVGQATGRCLTANPPNVNVSVAMAAVILDAKTGAPVQSNSLSCANSTTCTMSLNLLPKTEYHLLVSCVTARDTPTPVATALAMLQGVDVAALERGKDLWWAKFWQRSAVDFFETPIEDLEERGALPFESRPLEGFYYGMWYEGTH